MKERGAGFWHTYYGTPSEIIGWILLVVSIIYFVFVFSVAIGIA